MFVQQVSVVDPETDQTTYLSVVFNASGMSIARTNAEGQTLDEMSFGTIEAAAVRRMIDNAWAGQMPRTLFTN